MPKYVEDMIKNQFRKLKPSILDCKQRAKDAGDQQSFLDN